MDLVVAQWHIPKSRTGAAMDIPLAPVVVDWFRELRMLSGSSAYVLPAHSRSRAARHGGDTRLNKHTRRQCLGLARPWPADFRRLKRPGAAPVGDPADDTGAEPVAAATIASRGNPRKGAASMETDIGELIRRVNAQEPGARDALFGTAYPELRKLARARLRDGGRNTMLGTTALVHESYLRFMRAGSLHSDDRRAFFAYASSVMRSVIIDAVRERQAERRGGDLQRLTLNTALGDELPAAEGSVLHVHEALKLLAVAEPRLAQVVEMRYFGGYGESEIGEALGLTERTVRRDWDKARLLLAAMLDG